MVDINRIHLNFVDADILVDEQSTETVLAHQRIVFEYAKLRKVCKLLLWREGSLSANFFRVRRADPGFVEFQEGQKLIPRLV